MTFTAAMLVAPPANASGPWQLFWSWTGPNDRWEVGETYNGALTGSAESFTFAGGGAVCTGNGTVRGQATMDCSGPGWAAKARGMLFERPTGWMFSGTGFGTRNGITISANYVVLQITGRQASP